MSRVSVGIKDGEKIGRYVHARSEHIGSRNGQELGKCTGAIYANTFSIWA